MRLIATASTLALLISAGTADAQIAYVSNEKSNDVTLIDTATMEVIKTVPVGQRPRGITISPSGHELYVCASDD
ncbi:MAG: hypothetical protein AAFZ09_04050, partial [Pseudomonadota bacterium]